MRKIVPDTRARQGPAGKPVFAVLISAMLLCGIALAGFMLWTGSQSPDAPGQDASRRQITGSETGSVNSNPSDRVKPENPAYPVPASPNATGSAPRQ